MKRIVTGHDENGKSIFVKIGEPEHVIDGAGMLWKELWATYAGTKVPIDASVEPTKSDQWKSVFPEPGETRIRVIEYDPVAMAEVDNLPEKDLIDLMGWAKNELPGLPEHLEPDAPGMHTTNSVDYGVVLSGKLSLELDDGKTVDLEPGDVVIQNGTRHAWRIKEKCTMLFVLIGADRR
jgi:hypothetical protein